MALLEVENLKTYFHTRNGIVKAVDGISFSVDRNETLGIVGESGSGKSVSNYSLLRLLPMPPAKIESGKAIFDGVDLLSCPLPQLQKIRGKRISMIFQDPMTCLNPFLKVGEQVIEPLLIHEAISRAQARVRAVDMLKEVGILDAEKRFDQYPHQFSGGMRQRVMIAMALITKPELLIADEPTTALDVTVQAQILNIIKKLKKEQGMAVIFITHDLGVIADMADRVMVMYAGRVMEEGKTESIFYHSKHPYTRGLMASIPANQTPGQPLYSIPGLPPDVSREMKGCSFAPRCEYVEDRCRLGNVPLEAVGKGQRSACLRWEELK